jgi:hypothetical protein
VSLTRLLVDQLSDDTAAHRVDNEYDNVVLMADLLSRRAKDVANGEDAADTVKQLDALVRVWTEGADSHPHMRYQNSSNYEDALLVPADVAMTHDLIEYSTLETPWPTLQSMRDVDAESTLYQIPARKVPR